MLGLAACFLRFAEAVKDGLDFGRFAEEGAPAGIELANVRANGIGRF